MKDIAPEDGVAEAPSVLLPLTEEEGVCAVVVVFVEITDGVPSVAVGGPQVCPPVPQNKDEHIVSAGEAAPPVASYTLVPMASSDSFGPPNR